MNQNNEYTPMINQYLEVKSNYNDALLFFRLGDFYELFFEDALVASAILEIQLTQKSAGNNQKIPMCGVPYHAAKNYINKLVQNGKKVAIAEQLEEAGSSKLVKRDVVRIVTPGINMEDDLENHINNYLVSVYNENNLFFIAYSDITTGETFLETCKQDLKDLLNVILRLNTKEVIFHKSINNEVIKDLLNPYFINVSFLENTEINVNFLDKVNDLEENFSKVYALLINYIIETQKQNLTHMQTPIVIKNNSRIKLDRYTIKNLELTENLRNSTKTSTLFWFLDKTKTAFGSRFLRKEIESPLIDISQINKRHDIVEYLINDFALSNKISENLKQIYDLERIIGRISFSSVNPKELLQLRNSLNAIVEFSKLSDITSNDSLKELLDSIIDIKVLRLLLNNSINDDAPVSIKDLDVIKDGYNEELDSLRLIKNNSSQFLLELEEKERQRTGIKNLKVGYNRIFGYYFEVSKGQIDQVKDEFGYIRKQTLANCERYINAELKEKEATILNSVDKISKLELDLYNEIKNFCKNFIELIQENAKRIALLDMLLSFKIVSEENNLCRPIIIKKDLINIKEAYHPVIEKLTKNYIKNDYYLDNTINTLLITGPNMSGKSTYMRNLCLIVIMSQIGSFVPASLCEIKLFDNIFTRIGASDDLVGGKSTFMVEMDEVNYAISNATNNSLIIFDEIGRGTATYDGLALAQSILEYVNINTKCKTLFSTHYHELTKLESFLGTLKNVHVSAKEESGKLTFFHKVKDGAIDKSYGINVASLAGLPNQIIKRSKTILKELEKNNVELNLFNLTSEEDIGDFSDYNFIVEKLNKINISNITPLEALNILNELISEVQDEDK